MRHDNRKSRFPLVLIASCCLIAVAALGLSLKRPIENEYRLWRARQAIRSREFERALATLESAERSEGGNSKVYFLMARAHRHLEAYDIAFHCLAQAHQLGHPGDALEREKLLILAETAQLGSDDPRLQELTGNPGSDMLEIFESLVKGYMRLYEIGPAKLVLTAWEEEYPNDPQPRVYRGLLSEHNEKWRDAEMWFRQAMELAPDRRDIRLHVARAERKQHHYRDAIHQYQFALQKEEEVEALYGLGKCLQSQGRLPQAREAFLKGLERAPDDFNCLLALGDIEVDAGKGSEALQWLEPAAQQKPRDYDARYSLAMALLFSGQGDRARPHFQFAAQARLALSRVKALREYVAEHPESAEQRYEIGTALLEYGEVSEGLKWLGSVFKYEPGHPAAHAALADFYSAKGDEEAAARHRASAINKE